MQKTFWLYFGQIIVTSVRMPINSTDSEVKNHAIENAKILTAGTGDSLESFIYRVKYSSVV